MSLRKRSVLWEHYEKIDSVDAKCNICKQKVSYKSSTTNLKKHLLRRHPGVGIDIEETIAKAKTKSFVSAAGPSSATTVQPQSETTCQTLVEEEDLEMHSSAGLEQPESSKSKGKVQSRLHPFTIKKMTDKERKKIDNGLMKLFTRDYQPFSIVEDEGFISFVRALNPSYNLPSRKKISKTMIPAIYEAAKLELASILNNDRVRSVCLTTDCWTSTANESYLAVMVHFIYEGKLLSPTLDCRAIEGSHTSELLKFHIKEIVEFWGLSNKIIFSVSDNAANIVNALRNLLNYKHLGCAAHKLHLIVEKALEEIISVSEVIEKVKKILKHFRCSTKSWNILRECQKKEGMEVPKKLIISVATRWNSTYNMQQRFSDLELHIRTATARLNVDLPTLTAHEWILIKEICTTLKPFLDMTEVLSSQKFPSASCLITIVNGLADVLKRMLNEEFSEICPENKQLITFLLDDMYKPGRFENYENSGTLAKCSFLDPCFKTYAFRNEANVEKVKQEMKKLLVSRMKAAEIVETRSEPVKEVAKTSIWHSLLQTTRAKAQPVRGAEAKAIIELDHYLEQEAINIDEDPLQWWYHNRYKFPNLYEIAEELLCTVASSVPCEQLFSKAGMLLSIRRCQLSPEKARMLIFLNANEKILTKV